MSSLVSYFLGLSTPPLSALALAFALVLTAYTLYGALSRLYFSPIAHIPGPRLAALTFWNEFYYDVVLGGKYTWVIQGYHKRYGTRERRRKM